MNNSKIVTIVTEYITLGQLLKLASIISYGGEAKSFLLTTSVNVNGEKENRRGRKLYPDDIVTVNEETIVIKK